MKLNRILVAYGIVSIVELLASHSAIRYVTKPLLMILLGVYVYAFGLKPAVRNALLFTLLFAWLGDVFLLIPGNSALYFQLGLGSFLVMQLAYIRLFIKLSATRLTYLLIPVLVYVVGFLGFLYPNLPGALVPPVLVYALALGSMLYFASQISSVQLRVGAFLFVVSDSLLAFGKFYFEYPWNSFAVMSTYILAQLLLIHALCKLQAQR
ncbi:lysoplasmalogenase [Aquirufa regiilacus]